MEPTTRTAAGSILATSPTAAGRWSGLTADLLGMVLERLDSPLDHVRFAASCASWRAVVWTRPTRHVHPCLVLDPQDESETRRVYCPGGNGAVLPLVTRLNKTDVKCFVGSHPGGWVAYEAPLAVVNVFSGAEVAIPAEQKRPFVTRKVIFSGSPNSSLGCILAAITHEHEVVIRGLGSPESGWTTRRFYGQQVADIVFCNGHLYCLMESSKDVAKFEVGLDKHAVLAVREVQWLAIQNQRALQGLYFASEGDPDAHAIYIVELRGKLAMAVRRNWLPWAWPRPRNTNGPFFMVFELVDAHMNGVTIPHLYKWVEVTSLGDHALFLEPTCSKVVHASTGEHGGPRRNHIYYSHHSCYNHKNRMPDNAKEFFTSPNKDGCRAHYKEDETANNDVEGITSVGYYVCGGGHPPMWFFPPDP